MNQVIDLERAATQLANTRPMPARPVLDQPYQGQPRRQDRYLNPLAPERAQE